MPIGNISFSFYRKLICSPILTFNIHNVTYIMYCFALSVLDLLSVRLGGPIGRQPQGAFNPRVPAHARAPWSVRTAAAICRSRFCGVHISGGSVKCNPIAEVASNCVLWHTIAVSPT